MSDNWSQIKQEVDNYKSHVQNMHPDAAAEAKFSFLITKEEFERMLALKGDGTSLDGIRVYLAGTHIQGHLVPKVHAVAVEKVAAGYSDFNVPTEVPAAEALELTASGGGSTGSFPPCPPTCNVSNNILNS